MIVYFPLAGLALGGLIAYGSAGRRRQAGTILILLAAAWSLAILLNNPQAALWGAGPVLATLLLPRPDKRVPSTFEVLTRRTLTIAGLVLLALLLSSKLPVGLNPLLLNVVPWLVGAVGAAWVLSPIDAPERLQGQVLMVSATGAVVLTAVPGGSVTAAAVGAMGVMPLLAQREMGSGAGRQLMSSLVLLLAAVAATLAMTGLNLPRQSLGDLGFGFNGPVLLGAAVVLAAAALSAPAGTEWASLLAVLSLVAVAPSLRWSALAAVIAVATVTDRAGERPAWLGVACLAAVPVLGLAPPIWTVRLQPVALAVGMVLGLYAARTGLLRAVALPAIGFLVLLAVASLNAGNLTRFQWIAATGALLLIGAALLARAHRDGAASARLSEPLIMGLTLLSMSARDAQSLGAVAVALLLIDLSIVRQATLGGDATSFGSRINLLARSNWPPAATFAGVTLAVIASLQASLALGLLAAAMLAMLQVAPLLDRPALAPMTERTRSFRRWLAPGISLAVGIAPVLVLRMLRL